MDNGTVQEVTSTFTFEMPAQAVTVTGEFAQCYTITNATAAGANGTITIKGVAKYNERFDIIVAPAEGYELDKLTATGTNSSNNQEWTAANVINGKITFTMPRDNMTFTATFKQAKAYHITSSATIGSNPPQSPWKILAVVPTADSGETVTLTVSDKNLRLKSLKVTNQSDNTSTSLINVNAPVDFVGENLTKTFTFTMPAADVIVEAVAAQIQPIVKSATTNGTISVDKDFAEIGETVTITVTPASGYELDEITVTKTLGPNSTAVTVSENTFEVSATGTYTVAATFKEITGEGGEGGGDTTPSTPTVTPATPVEPVAPTTSDTTSTSTTTSDTTSSAAATVAPVEAKVEAEVKVGETVTVKSDDLGGDVTVAADKEDTALEGAKLEVEATNDKTATSEKINAVVGSEASAEVKAVVEVAVKAVEEGNAITLDISFTKDGNSVQPSLAVTITAPVPAALKGADKLFVYHVTSTGLEDLTSKCTYNKEKGHIAISNNAFSPYIISKVELKAQKPATSEAGTTSTTAPTTSNPSTGVALALAPVVLAGAALVVFTVKKRK